MKAKLETYVQVGMSGQEARELVEELIKAIPHIQNCMSRMPCYQMSALMEKLGCLNLESSQ